MTEVVERLGPQTLRTRIGRDAMGRIASVTDALGNVATWRRDGLGRLVQVDDPDAGATTFDLDDAGNLRRRVEARGATVVTDYDELSRPLVEQLTDAQGVPEERVVYHYDDASPLFPGDLTTGDVAWVEDGAGAEHYRHDERARVVESVRALDGKSYDLQHVYDDLDRVTSVTYPDGRSLDFRYGPRGLLESVPGVIASIAYDEHGLVTRREHANGAVTTASYDELERLTALATESRGKAVQSLSYAYDRVGNLTALGDALRASGPLSRTRTCNYDDLYRLVSALGGDRSWSYAFNAVGDFTNKSDVGDYTYGKGHEVASAGGKGYGYDEAGEVVARPGSKLAYDAKGRLKSVALDDGTVVSYRYDYGGRRVVKESKGPRGSHRTVYVNRLAEERDGQTVDYVFAGNARVARLGGDRPTQLAAAALAALPPSLSWLAVLLFAVAAALWLPRSLACRAPATAAMRARRLTRPLVAAGTACGVLALATAGCGHQGGAAAIAALHYHADHLGGVAVITDEGGNVVSEVSYDPFGGEIAGSTEPYAFTGKEYEAEAGLYDFGARAYDPVLGRFLSPDPVAVFEPEKVMGEGDQDNGRGSGPGTRFHENGARMYRLHVGRSISPDTAGPDLANPAIFNRYAYVLNNPYKYVDPTGRTPVGALKGAMIGGSIGGAIGFLLGGGGGVVVAVFTGGGGAVVVPPAAVEGGALGSGIGIAVGHWIGDLVSGPGDAKKSRETAAATSQVMEATAHTQVTSGSSRAPQQGGSDSIYEQLSPGGDVRSRTFYDQNGRPFSRQDFDHPHGGMQPHEHQRQFDANGKPKTSEQVRPVPSGYDNKPTPP